MYTREQLNELVPPIVTESLGLIEPLKDDQTFESVDADSIDLATLAIGIAEEFDKNMEIGDIDLDKIKTSNDIVEYLLAQQILNQQ